MSRTDKDEPVRVRAGWFEPQHYCMKAMRLRYRDRLCDLPAEPDRGPAGWRVKGCSWKPVRSWDRRYYYTRGPRSFDRHVYWWRPDRANARDLLKSAAKEHRAAGSVDSEPAPRQHRHAPWGGGWWD